MDSSENEKKKFDMWLWYWHLGYAFFLAIWRNYFLFYFQNWIVLVFNVKFMNLQRVIVCRSIGFKLNFSSFCDYTFQHHFRHHFRLLKQLLLQKSQTYLGMSLVVWHLYTSTNISVVGWHLKHYDVSFLDTLLIKKILLLLSSSSTNVHYIGCGFSWRINIFFLWA